MRPRAPCSPAGSAPVRPPRSVRRTSTISAVWPQGYGHAIQFVGRARDAFTGTAGSLPVSLGEATLHVETTGRRDITAITASYAEARLQALLGANPGGSFRSAVRDAVPEEVETASPLHLLLDDLVGASLVSTWAWQRVDSDWAATRRRMGAAPGLGKEGSVIDVCSGFRAGSSALLPDGTPRSDQSSAPVPSVRSLDDPAGWHDFPEVAGVSYRRARRMDVTEADVVVVDIGFQDSVVGPTDQQRFAVHEYGVRATATSGDLRLLTIDVVGHLLPYPECPGAIAAAQLMKGRPMAGFRRQVGKNIRGPGSCTHLNDVLRSLADVPRLVEALRWAADD